MSLKTGPAFFPPDGPGPSSAYVLLRAEAIDTKIRKMVYYIIMKNRNLVKEINIYEFYAAESKRIV